MNRRRSAFSKHPIQRKYLTLVLFAMLGPTILATGCIYYLIWQTVARELAIPELIAESLFPAYRHVNQIILIGLPLLFGIIVMWAIKITHRFTGPLYRIEQDLTEMIRKHDFTKPIRIRKRDEIHSLVNAINQALRTASKPRSTLRDV